jgi:hypothetical protein
MICPGKPALERGTTIVRVLGRALDKDGKLVADTIRQEHYVEDRFEISVSLQRAMVKILTAAGDKRVRLPEDLARLLASHAYLGQLDVNPVAPPGGKGGLDRCEFWAQKIKNEEKGSLRARVEGKSSAVGASIGEGGDGRLWNHEVQLAWEGLIDVKGQRITRLLLMAHGAEKLRWGNKGGLLAVPSDVARLPAGHAIDLACKVRYGFLGEPVPDDEATDVPARQKLIPDPSVPEEVRKGIVQSFGPAFLIFHARVQKELHLSEAQKKRIDARRDEMVQDALRFLQTLERLNPHQREKKLGPYRQQVQEKLSDFVRDTIDARQLRRLRQIELQQYGLFALGQPEVQKELKITDEQRQRFMNVIQSMEQQIRPLIEEAQSGGEPERIFPKIMKTRKRHEAKIEAILNAGQKKQWKEMLGKPFDPGD